MGLIKLLLGIGFVLAVMKAMVAMAWALSIAKYAPDLWPAFAKTGQKYHFTEHEQLEDKHALLDVWLKYAASKFEV